MPTIRIIHKMPTISPMYRIASSDLLLSPKTPRRHGTREARGPYSLGPRPKER
jgi:hypothetical protein